MKRLAIFASLAGISLLMACAVSATQPQIYITRTGSIVVGYLSAPGGGWRLHICLGAQHSRHLPVRPGRGVTAPTASGSPALYTFCRHGLVFLPAGSAFPANPSGVFPGPPTPPLPTRQPGISVTNQIPTRVIRTPVPPLPIPSTQLIQMEAQRIQSGRGRAPVLPPVPPDALTTTTTP